jgi:hypothetical protein
MENASQKQVTLKKYGLSIVKQNLYNHLSTGDPDMLTVTNSTNDDDFHILKEQAESAIIALKNGKAAGVDNILAEPGSLPKTQHTPDTTCE